MIVLFILFLSVFYFISGSAGVFTKDWWSTSQGTIITFPGDFGFHSDKDGLDPKFHSDKERFEFNDGGNLNTSEFGINTTAQLFQEEGIGFYEGNLNFSPTFTLKPSITNEPSIVFGESFELVGETDREKRIYIFGFFNGLYTSFIGVNISSQNITMILRNQTRVYTIDNFPLEDDCLDENKTACFVKWEEKVKLIIDNTGQVRRFDSREDYNKWMEETTRDWIYNEDGSVDLCKQKYKPDWCKDKR